MTFISGDTYFKVIYYINKCHKENSEFSLKKTQKKKHWVIFMMYFFL